MANDMFNIVTREILSRRLSTERFVSLIDAYDPSRIIEIATCKGLVFIQMYGAYEYTIKSSVQAALLSINSKNFQVANICKELLCLVLDPLWTAASDVGRRELQADRGPAILDGSRFHGAGSLQIGEQ